jgi:hypothetical protein
MKKILKRLLFIIIPVIILAVPYFMDRISADEADYTEITVTPTPGAGTSTSGNKYLILEIVPYKALGEMGYLVGGQEPIDEALFTSSSNAAGMLSFLGGAISSYQAYKVKDLPSSGNQDSGWVPIKTYASQGGYFKYVGYGNGYYQKKTNQTAYTRVADGTGNYMAKLDSENTDIYTGSWNQTNYRNVNAYFAYGTSTGASLYSTSNTYQPVSVIRVSDHTGDYDYNADKAAFELNKGKGEYDVLFKRSYGGSNSYYMTNDYEIVDDCSGEYSWTLTYVEKTGGSYTRNTAATTFTYSEYDHSNCAYNWVEDSGAASRENFTVEGTAGTQSEKIWIRNQKVIVMKQYSFGVTLVNNEWFKRLVLGLSDAQCDQMDVEVVTLTPAQLNTSQYQHYLKEANLFYINANYNHNYSYITLYESYSYEGLALSSSQKYGYLQAHDLLSFGVNDLSWTSTMLAFNRIAGVKSDGSLGGYRAGVVFDYRLFQDAINGASGYQDYRDFVTVSFTENGSNATVCNVAKLYIMVYQRDAAEFYKLFLSPTAPLHITTVSSGAASRNSTGTTGSFVRPGSSASATSVEATFWNGNTFCPYYLDYDGTLVNWTDWWNRKSIIAQYIPNYNISSQTTDMTSNVLVFNGTDIFTEKFIQPAYSMPQDALDAAKSYLASIGVDTSSVSSLKLFNYLVVSTDSGTGYGNGTEEDSSGTVADGGGGTNLRSYYSVLNIEPTADFAASEANINRIFVGYNIKITNMTSAQFNENIQDINTHYDMIYIGGASGRYNKSGSTLVYNDESLGQSVYHSGDKITASDTRTYTGSDFTEQKIGELYNFLEAGYPVVMEKEIYQLSSSVKNNTKLYSFIQDVTRAGSSYKNNIFNYESFYNGSSIFQPNGDKMTALKTRLNIERPQIQIIEPVIQSDAETNYFYLNDRGEFVITFAVLPNKRQEDESLYYSAYLYMDYNNDGIFSSGELMNVNLRNGVSNIGFHESYSTRHQYTYDMSGYNGAHQWKVEVIRQSVDAAGGFHDTPIRSEITGYVSNTDRQTINILQIMDNITSDSTAYSLQKAVTENANSLIRKWGGLGTTQISGYRTDGKLVDYDLVFHTMTVEEFLGLYAENPYDPSNPPTNHLADYQLLIIDNQTDVINNSNGALTNIKAAISGGKSVIFTKGSITSENQGNYLSTPLFEVNQKTYAKLCRIAKATNLNPYYIFNFTSSGFASAMNSDSTYTTGWITKANEGVVAEYPYKIDSAAIIRNNMYSEDALKAYSLTDAEPLIGWFCLSDTASPTVRVKTPSATYTVSTYSGMYSSSPEDVRNNYYLVNRGNVYYSGIVLDAQHDSAGNDMEIKLFINTITAAYRYTGHAVMKAPEIEIDDVAGQEPEDDTVELTKALIGDRTEIPVTFTISNSSSKMELSILWDASEAATSGWKLYKSTDFGPVLVTDYTDLVNMTYMLYVPVDALAGTHTLTLSAKNRNTVNSEDTLTTTIVYNGELPVITLENSNLITIQGLDNTKQYMYVDIDYATIDYNSLDSGDEGSREEESDALADRDPVRLEFAISNISDPTKVRITVTDSSGNAISVVDNKVYNRDSSLPDYSLNAYQVVAGSYYIELPVNILSGVSSKEVVITAAVDDSLKAQASVTLKRRSLFQLD